jgi:hypothetical protein
MPGELVVERCHGRDKLIRVIVNLNSQNIALEELMIPSTAEGNVAPTSK